MKRLIMCLYVTFAIVLFVTAHTLAKFTTDVNPTVSIPIGEKLYFNYERGQLYRNNTLIIGFETFYDDNGESRRRIETMNVNPGDTLKYYFTVSNFNEHTSEFNGIQGEFIPTANAVLALPVKGETHDVSCMITYKAIATDESQSDGIETLLTSKLNLKKYSSEADKQKYQFTVEVKLDDQMTNTTHEDYFDATLTIYLFVNAASV